MIYYTVYKVTNKINGKFYIGMHKTKDLNDGYMGSGKLITRAIKKYGLENFNKEIIHIFDNEQDMRAKEKELVVLSEQSYNLLEGGYGGFGFINKNNLCDYSKHAKLSGKVQRERFKKGNYSSSQWWFTKDGLKKRRELAIESLRKKYPVGWIFSGRKHTETTKKIIGYKNSQHQKGSGNSQFGTCWINDGSKDIKIKKHLLDEYLEKGYIKGRIKISRSNV